MLGAARFSRGCLVRLKVKAGCWIAEIQDTAACESTVAEMKMLDPETRANLARHLETNDQEQKDQIKVLRKRNVS